MNMAPKIFVTILCAWLLQGCVVIPQDTYTPKARTAFYVQPVGTGTGAVASTVGLDAAAVAAAEAAPPTEASTSYVLELTRAVLVGCITSGNCW